MQKAKHTLVGKLSTAESTKVLDVLGTIISLGKESALDDTSVFRWSYLESEYLSKFVGQETASAELRKARAIEKWLSVEQRNAQTNIRLYTRSCQFAGRVEGRRFSFSSDEVIERARLLIARVIGDEPDPEAVGNFSSGASTSLRRELGNAARKFTVQAHVTPTSWLWSIPELMGYATWRAQNKELLQPEFVRGNVLFTVPKTTEIDRVAAKEPDFNMWAQKRLGDQIRGHLRRFGIDLNDQGKNQSLARKALSAGLATVDLSSASDSMTSSLVGLLLPPGWFVELNAHRSPETLIGQDWHENAMFSSMGNGFTFELESLLFYALTRTVCSFVGLPGRVSVYGDDIIAPSAVVRHLKRVFGFFGFLVNPKKTHSEESDLLRESCGAHYYAGYDVKPFYVRGPLSTQEDLIHLLNSFRKWLDVEPFSFEHPEYIRDLWWEMAKGVDRRLWGGRDTSRKGRLVTPHAPGWEIVRVKREKKALMEELQSGLYMQALRASMYRTTPSETSSAPLSEDGIAVLRRKKMTYWESVIPHPRW